MSALISHAEPRFLKEIGTLGIRPLPKSLSRTGKIPVPQELWQMSILSIRGIPLIRDDRTMIVD